MKKNNLKKGIFTALLLASPFVTAGTDYPAADFQPKILYQDESYQHQGSGSSSSSQGEKSTADANYPAANFQPEVLYIDKGYQHKAGTVTNSSVPLKRAAVSSAAPVEAETTTSSDDSSMNPLFAIVVLGVAGFLYSKAAKGTAKPKQAAVSRKPVNSGNFRNADGVSGVAKYLQNKVPKLSSVDKYLEANQVAPKSGVAKYVARKVVAAKKTASEKVTGVEKYMRNQKRG
ncbi:hypothetical protein BJAS_P3747 [Bathymodiolus japonicus methanotrophic gill symbiont]|uniref:hypothetical protein n=1 Tax=Bathymodiolus japonicus methanotrophic gill symbiont TaxID=113269 RepID=UPI001B4F64E5|nr:hypothetical protein [Bathymodiolus japonicus methanotrophic gill symbiont]GFO73129.1 hypothetical protein BJAS_P3747 [Bathymodiolus japonicus methanotrophic gill symbiont]